MITRQSITILGAGLSGVLAAILLAKRGFRPRIYERDSDPRLGEDIEGRSINLALAERGRRALARAGLLDDVMRYTIAMPGRLLHAESGELSFQPYGQRPNECIYSISRADLSATLLHAAEALGVELEFNQRCVKIDAAERQIVFESVINGQRNKIAMNPLLAADGAGSIVRRSINDYADLGMKEDLLDHGYKELTIPPTKYDAYRMNPHALHIWPRGGFMLIALANPDGDFTATLFLARDATPGFEQLGDNSAVREFFTRNFPDAVPLMPRLAEEFANNPVGIMGTVRCQRWHLGGDVLLFGDAAHAIVPFHGQGMNACFEDCLVLDDLLAEHPASWQALFEEFQLRRRINTNAIADMALENYVEMRDTVRDPRFHLKKALAFELEKRASRVFIPRYSMVMFHPEIGYRDALTRGAIQAEILVEFTEGCATLNEVDVTSALAATLERLAPID